MASRSYGNILLHGLTKALFQFFELLAGEPIAFDLNGKLQNVVVNDGADGADGNTVLNGSGAPSNVTDGVNGDFYIDTAAWDIYGPKAAGVWPSGVSLIGPPA